MLRLFRVPWRQHSSGGGAKMAAAFAGEDQQDIAR